ncbi:ABC transporter ATP-binding protein [Actinobaculum massiliense]|uniref:ABC transporter ATP-binding protein n=1 Tax=Actinobaculum massiliense TaxID=202789 RepID=UPI00288A4A9E|nr:ABC transporter ATP-binding protein [Actinobaculum massiliense]
MADQSAQVAEGKPADRDKEKAVAGQAAIRRLTKPIRGRILVAQILTIISGILAIAPYIALVELGRVLTDAGSLSAVDTDQVWTIIAILTGAFSLRLLLYFIALLVTHFSDLKLRDILRRGIIERLAKAPLSWFTESNSGIVRKAVQDDTTTVHTVIAHGPIDKLNAVVSPVALVIYAFVIDWRLGLLSIATIPLYVGTYAVTMRDMPEKTAEMDTKLQKVSATMVEFVSGISVVKAFGRVGEAHGNYIKAANEFSQFYRAWCMPLVTISCLSFTWVSIPILLLVNLGGGALLVSTGAVTVAEVLTTTLIAIVVPGTIQTVSAIAWSYQLAGGAAMRICSILDVENLETPARGKKPNGTGVEIENVHFSYGDTHALRGVSLQLQPRTITALLGPSGSGKSTLATLIARFQDPDQGSVKTGGVDVREMDQETLYRTVSFVLQDAQLLSTSVRANIALGKPEASLEEVRAAARAAQIDDYIMSLPDGYDTVLGQDTGLSGGQQQRIAIARALLIDAPILLLDEATAFADPESETEIQEALNVLVKGRTVLVIAHRPRSIRGVDQIAVMDHGEVTAVGTHKQLLDEPHYRALLAQSGALAEKAEN